MAFCTSCGTQASEGAKFCTSCGAAIVEPVVAQPAAVPVQPVQPAQPAQAYQPVQPNQAMSYQPAPQQQYNQRPAEATIGTKNKIAAGLLALFLGTLGIHKFYLGYTKEGIIMLLVSVIGAFLTLGIATLVMAIIALVEAVLYLTKSDADFYQTYEVGHKGWF